MRFSVFIPPQAETKPVPVLYYLSGLTCTEENFTVKSGVQRYAAEYGLLVVAPDTSPRNTGIPGEDDQWDLGTGAGFYVDATQEPWASHYKMYTYVVEELPQIIAANFSIIPERQGIFGHSMGGHGALVCALRNPDKYVSVSAFAPIAVPMRSPWGQKIFTAYLGEDQQMWQAYDATNLIHKVQLPYPILIDQGDADSFYRDQYLLPEVFVEACEKVGQKVIFRLQPGYDHSYFMIASFMGEHLRFHASLLGVAHRME